MALSLCGRISLILISYVLLTFEFCEAKLCGYQSGRTYTKKQDCTELEHCQHFNAGTGQCTGTGNQCQPGWMGPGCQYFNLAYKSGGRDAFFDGIWNKNVSTREITVQLHHTFIVSAINVISNPTSGLTISVEDNTGQKCYNGLFPENTWTIFCNRVLKTEVLKIIFGFEIEVQEVEVYGGQNVALWRQTSQSSTYNGSGISYTSDKAVDGSDSGHKFTHNSCTHTATGRNDFWWKVELGNFYSVMSILIANRDDRNRKRIDGFSAHGKSRNGTEIAIYQDSNPPSDGRRDIWIDSGSIPREPVNEIIIRGNISDKEKILTLCEVYVFACIPGIYGQSKCSQYCPTNCQSSESCLNDQFSCSNCVSGWSGSYCDQETPNNPQEKYCAYLLNRTSGSTDGCTALEHCVNGFNASTGACTGQHNQCEKGWMGPGCQYVNLAINSLNSEKVFDGNLTTGRRIPEATVDLKGTFFVTAINIHVWSGQTSTVNITDNDGNTCYNGGLSVGTATIYFSRACKTNIIKIGFSSEVFVKEIEVFGGENVALWKATHQSTDYKTYTSDKATDGKDGGGDFGTSTCTHTKDYTNTKPSWEVDLGRFYSITSIRIRNRNIQQNRIDNFTVYGISANGQKEQIYNDAEPNQIQDRNDIWIDSSRMPQTRVNKISIELPYGDNQILTLCEVYVFACSPTIGGRNNCLSFCTQKHCSEDETCMNNNFSCPNCELGWAGADCRQAVQCRRPSLTKHVTISPDKSTYTYNTTISITCEEGYKLQGSETAVCGRNGSFVFEDNPSCDVVQCGRPSLTNHVTISPDNSTYTYNTTISITCKEGYNLQGSETAVCGRNGSFLFEDSPYCHIVQCGMPPLTNHMTISPDNSTYTYNTTISFTCEEGYNLQGSETALCGRNGSFVFKDEPSCHVVLCGKPSLTNHVTISPDNSIYTYNTTISIACKEGYYNLEGSEMAVCGRNGSFEFEDNSSCQVVKCAIPNFVVNDNSLSVTENKNDYEFKDTIHFTCNGGKTLKGQQKSVCGQNRTFVVTIPPSCEASPNPSSQTALIAGVSVGVIAILVLAVVVVVLVRRRKRSNKKASSRTESHSLNNINNQYAEVTAKPQRNIPPMNRQNNVDETPAFYANGNDLERVRAAGQDEYYDFTSALKSSSTSVKVADFKDFLESKRRDKEYFSDQFKKFYTGLQFPTTAAQAPGNRSKNKYKNIYPYDETRVILKAETGHSNSDFINASFVHGYGHVKSYIAAQGPLVDTIDDFWWMVWNEQCEKIVMLTNLIEDGKVKCIQYWPDDEKMTAGNLTLEVVDVENFADFTIRTFCLKNATEQKIIHQYHFTAWPDKGVPLYASSLVHFHSKVKNSARHANGPLLVHCSAGVGRTGTFIALDYLIQQAKETERVDVFVCVETLRRQRVNMVQTLEQYNFIHNSLVEALMCTSSDPTTAQFPFIYRDLLKKDRNTGKQNLDLQFEDLTSGSLDIPESAYSLAKDPQNKNKNRYTNILPIDGEMPKLWDEDKNRVYINAVFLPANRSTRSFVVTQMPLKETVDDFWRLLIQQKVSTIIMLNQTEPDTSTAKKNIGIYWPQSSESQRRDSFSVSLKSSSDKEMDYTVIDLVCKIEYEEETEVRRIRIFKCKFWPDSQTIPSSATSFLNLVNAVEMHHDRNNTGPIVVHCMNGAEKSGLFCVLQVVLERMKIEQDVAIHHVIQQMRSVRKSIIPNVEQYKFCYDVVLEYMKQYDAYSNFQ